MPIIKPDLDVTKKFDKAVTPIYKKWTALIHETNGVSKHRDELLPLLMTGQVSVMQLNNDLTNVCTSRMFICIFVERYSWRHESK
jgi:hypothetical protein